MFSALIKSMLHSKRSATSLIIPALLACVTVGTISGAISANILSALEYDRLSANIDYYFRSFFEPISREAIFFEALVKYGKTPLFIWFLAFVPPGAVVSFIFVFVKGMGLGFTTAFLTRRFGAAGLYYTAVLYLLQNLVVVPAYLYISYESLNFAADSLKIPHKKKPFIFGIYMPDKLLEYAISAVISLACVVLSALIEAYCVPMLASLVI